MKISINKDRYLLKKVSLQNNFDNYLLNIIENYKKDIFSILPDVGLYLYGGIAQGIQNKPYSDLDLLLFSHKEIDKVNLKNIKKIEEAYSKQLEEIFAYVGIEIVTPNIYNQQKLVYSLIIQYLSIFLGGYNVQKSLSSVKLDKDLGFQLNYDFIDRISKKANTLYSASSKKEQLLACRWIMKKLLRTSFGLIIDKVNYFDNSIEGISDLLLEFYPKQGEIIKKITDLALNPQIDQASINIVMENYFIRLQNEWDKQYKEYIYKHKFSG